MRTCSFKSAQAPPARHQRASNSPIPPYRGESLVGGSSETANDYPGERPGKIHFSFCMAMKPATFLILWLRGGLNIVIVTENQ